MADGHRYADSSEEDSDGYRYVDHGSPLMATLRGRPDESPFNRSDRYREMERALERVQQLHRVTHALPVPYCVGCADKWPCATTRAMEGKS